MKSVVFVWHLGSLLPGGLFPGGIPACTEADMPHVNRITHACQIEYDLCVVDSIPPLGFCFQKKNQIILANSLRHILDIENLLDDVEVSVEMFGSLKQMVNELAPF